MPDKATIERAKKDKQQGKSASTQAGEFVKSEIDKVREGKHGVRNTRQAIAIGLSEARRAGVNLPPPKKGATSEKTRSQAREKALQRESSAPVSREALSKQAQSAAKKRSPANRSTAAKKASATKGPRERSAAAKKAARTRASHR